MHISALAITQRHPAGLFCKTDRLYAEVADFIYVRLKKELTGFLDDRSLKRASVSCALFFEDYFSETHQMNVFVQWHQKKFGSGLPFYDYSDEREFLVKQFQFVMWLAVCAESESSVINPENEGLSEASLRILSELNSSRLWGRMQREPNEQLAEYLYCEETQTDIMEIKKVLIWIQRYSFFGYWYDLPGDETMSRSVDVILTDVDDSKRSYAIDSLSAYGLQTWPCSLRAQDIYAMMIRYEMEDDNDPYAKNIEDIECKKFALYHVVDYASDAIVMEDYDGTKFNVDIDSFSSVKDLTKDGCHYVTSSFVRFGGVYHCNGISRWYPFTDKEYKQYQEDRARDERNMHMEGQFDEFIKKNKGRRVFFFENFNEYVKWLDKKLGIKNKASLPGSKALEKEPLMVFFEPNGQMTMALEIEGISSPDNPFYDKKNASNKAFSLLVSPTSISPDCIHYLLENGFLKDAAFNHIKGHEAGHTLAHNNAEFLIRCFRRDIRWWRY